MAGHFGIATATTFLIVLCLFTSDEKMNSSSTLIPAIFAPRITYHAPACDVFRFAVMLRYSDV